MYRWKWQNPTAYIDCAQIDRTFLLTDCAICTYPALKTKVQLIKNAVSVAKGMGMQCPKVVPLAAVEQVNPSGYFSILI